MNTELVASLAKKNKSINYDGEMIGQKTARDDDGNLVCKD